MRHSTDAPAHARTVHPLGRGRPRRRAPALALLAALGLAAGCSDEAILLTISGPDTLFVPAEAATLTITVTEPSGGSLSQQVIGPFSLTASDGLPFVIALLPGVVFDEDVLISVHTEDMQGRLTAAGSTLARFEPNRLVRTNVNLAEIACADDAFEVNDEGIIGASLNLLEGGDQPDLRVCGSDLERGDRFNFLVPQGFGLQIVLHGSDPPSTLSASLKCAGPNGVFESVTPVPIPLAPNRVLATEPNYVLPYRTCVLDVAFVATPGGTPPPDTSYGFLALAFEDDDTCMPDGQPPNLEIDVSFYDTAVSPPMTLCPPEFDTFRVIAEFDRLLEIAPAGPTAMPLSGSITCPDGAGSIGTLPLYARTSNGPGTTTECELTIFGATSPLAYALRVSAYPLQDCPDDGAEPNDALETAINVVGKGWMTPTTGGVSPPLAVCGASPVQEEDDDWFSFNLAGSPELMQVSFMYDASLMMGDVDLEVWLPGATSVSRFAAGEVTSVPIQNPPPGMYLFRFLCYAATGPCGNVYRFSVSME